MLGGGARRFVRTQTNTYVHGIPAKSSEESAVEAWIEIGILYAAYLVIVAIPPVMGAYNTVTFKWNEIAQSPAAKWLGLSGNVEREFELNDDDTPLKAGDKVGEFTVTSGVGLRKSPGGVGSTNHQGIDLNTPTGTKVFVPRRTKVECLDSAKGGRGARFKGVRGEVTLWHLSQCSPGRKQQGDLIALSGNTGSATTGPHLHVEVRLGGEIVNPEVRDVFPLLGLSPSAGEFSPNVYKKWIAKQESGKDYSAINPDSGALGKYQFMPATMASVAKGCLDSVPTSSQFLANPDLQEKVMDCYLQKGWERIEGRADDGLTQCRMLASYHYSGDPNKYQDRTPQTYRGRPYPSIDEYTSSVCKELAG